MITFVHIFLLFWLSKQYTQMFNIGKIKISPGYPMDSEERDFTLNPETGTWNLKCLQHKQTFKINPKQYKETDNVNEQ